MPRFSVWIKGTVLRRTALADNDLLAIVTNAPVGAAITYADLAAQLLLVDRTGDQTNVLDYSSLVVGDDWRPAVQAASDAAGDGGTVYFPPGLYTLKTATAGGDYILRTYPNQTWYGDGRFVSVVKVGDSFGNYASVIANDNPSNYTGRWEMHSMGIDQNGANGNLLDVPLMATYPKLAIRVGSYDPGDSVTITDSWFGNGDNVNTLYLYADVVDVSGNHFTGTGADIDAPTHDHSTIYITTTVDHGTQVIADNTFHGIQGCGAAVSAIETHGGSQTITGNAVSDYITGGNLTGVGPVPTLGITCVGNTLVGVVIGFTVYSAYTVEVPSGTACANVVISDNAITIDREPWTGIAGFSAIAPGIRVAMTDAPIEGLTISNNSITYLPITTDVTGDNQSCGINIVASAALIVYDLQIVNNTIASPLAAGIRIDMTVKRGRVSGNVVVDPGQSGDGSVDPVYCSAVMLGHTLEDITVDNNLLVDTRGTHLANYCVYSNPSSAVNCFARDNNIRLLDGAAQLTPFWPAANTAGASFFIEEAGPTGQVTFFNVKVGSTVKNTATGKVWTQTTTAVGVGWKQTLALGATTTTSAPSAGGGSALPATPAGYVTLNVNGTDRQVAYY